MPPTPARRPPRLAAAFARLEADREHLARAWLVRTLERRSLEELEGLALGPLARELPLLLDVVVADLVSGRPVAGGAWLGRLAALAGSVPSRGEATAGDVAALQSVLLFVLTRELGDEPTLLAEGEAALAATFAALHAAGVEALLAREAPAPALDPVTGLSPGPELLRRLDELVEAHVRYGRPFALLMVDVDGLERVVAALGRAAGDRALARAAHAAASALRRLDTLARLDRGRLGALLPEQGAAGGRAAARRVSGAVAAAEAPERERVGLAVGVAACPDHGTEAGALLQAA